MSLRIPRPLSQLTSPDPQACSSPQLSGSQAASFWGLCYATSRPVSSGVRLSLGAEIGLESLFSESQVEELNDYLLFFFKKTRKIRMIQNSRENSDESSSPLCPSATQFSFPEVTTVTILCGCIVPKIICAHISYFICKCPCIEVCIYIFI